LAAVVTGCSTTVVTPGTFTDTSEQPPPATPTAAITYPAAPYGLGIGSVIPNFDFQGLENACPQGAVATCSPPSQVNVIRLSDFYNPHAFDTTYKPASPEEDDRLFPTGSGYANAGKAKPTVLLVDVASVWCGPCNQEAQTLLPMKHDLYSACGGEFLLNLHDSAQPGTTATPLNLKQWTQKYRVNFPAVIDPEYKLDPLFAADAFPNNFVIDTTTMKIVTVVAGEVVPGICNDNTTICGTPTDLALCSDTSKMLNCGGLAACPSGSCTQYQFWTDFESKLDKSRAGCTVK
jgi:hypothetical protein